MSFLSSEAFIYRADSDKEMGHHYSRLGHLGFGDAVGLCGREGAKVATAAARERIKSSRNPKGAPFLAPNVGWCGIRWGCWWADHKWVRNTD